MEILRFDLALEAERIKFNLQDENRYLKIDRIAGWFNLDSR